MIFVYIGGKGDAIDGQISANLGCRTRDLQKKQHAGVLDRLTSPHSKSGHEQRKIELDFSGEQSAHGDFYDFSARRLLVLPARRPSQLQSPKGPKGGESSSQKVFQTFHPHPTCFIIFHPHPAKSPENKPPRKRRPKFEVGTRIQTKTSVHHHLHPTPKKYSHPTPLLGAPGLTTRNKNATNGATGIATIGAIGRY